LTVGAFAIERSSPDRLVASGELGFATAAEALATGVQLLDGGACTIDLAAVTESDSAGLAVLIEWLAHAHRKGCALRYENVPSQILAIARISDVQDLLLPP
jgi:phospholipid transport system transporter-binding protein